VNRSRNTARATPPTTFASSAGFGFRGHWHRATRSNGGVGSVTGGSFRSNRAWYFSRQKWFSSVSPAYPFARVRRDTLLSVGGATSRPYTSGLRYPTFRSSCLSRYATSRNMPPPVPPPSPAATYTRGRLLRTPRLVAVAVLSSSSSDRNDSIWWRTRWATSR
jgi:hypothetical protein